MLRLVAANLNYSSWSMRAWLGLKKAGTDFKVHDVGIFNKEGWKERILSFSGAGKVPILIDGSLSIHESMAILETVAERCPEANLWPKDAALRARGRGISQEMAAGFPEIRNLMPCNLRGRASTRPEGKALQEEIDRVFDIFSASLATSEGDFLLGDFSIADAMYFPVLSRFRTYGVELPEAIAAYSERVFADAHVRELEELASEAESIASYDAKLRA